MANPYSFVKSCRTGQLHAELDAAHPGKVKTVRGTGSDSDGLSTGGAVLHDGTLTDGQVQAVIDAHTPVATNTKKIQDAAAAMIADLDNGIAITTAGNPTAAQNRAILDGIMKNQRKIIQYIAGQIVQ